jgi:hypothetical protein
MIPYLQLYEYFCQAPLVPQGIDRVECLAMRAEHLVQRFPEILVR